MTTPNAAGNVMTLRGAPTTWGYHSEKPTYGKNIYTIYVHEMIFGYHR